MLIAQYFVTNTNDEIKTQWSAEATVVVAVPDPDARSEEPLSEELAAAEEIALEANENILLLPGTEIVSDAESGALIFHAMGRTEEDALATVEEMRDNYIAEDPNFGTESQLRAAFAEARLLEARLEELTFVEEVPLTPEEELAQAELDALIANLNAQRAAIEDEMSTVTAELLDATESADINALTEERDELQVRLSQVLLQLTPLQPVEPQAEGSEDGEGSEGQGAPIDPDRPITEQWEIESITARLTELQTDSATAIINDITGAEVELPEATAIDETPAPLSSTLFLIAGFLGGVLMASAFFLLRDRSKRTIWSGTDVVGVPLVAEGPLETESVPAATPEFRAERRRTIQNIRSAIVASLPSLDRGSIVGFVSPDSTDSKSLRDLSYDVSASMAWIGRSVLLIDVGFAALDDYGRSEIALGLAKLAGNVSDHEDMIDNQVTETLESATPVLPGLNVLLADPEKVDPVDLLDGKPFSRLLERAVEVYDVVILVAPPADIAPSKRIITRLDQLLLVATQGKTSMDEIESEILPVGASNILYTGVVLVRRGIGWLKELMVSIRGPKSSAHADNRYVASSTSSRSAVARWFATTFRHEPEDLDPVVSERLTALAEVRLRYPVDEMDDWYTDGYFPPVYREEAAEPDPEVAATEAPLEDAEDASDAPVAAGNGSGEGSGKETVPSGSRRSRSR